MNSLQQARENLGMSAEEFALLLGWSNKAVPELESEPEHALGTLRPLAVLLMKAPRQSAQILIEERTRVLPQDSPDREALASLVRKVHGCTIA